MKLAELLQYIGSELLDDRAELLEGVGDSIWSDESVVRQLNEASRILCREAWVLEDLDIDSVDSDGNLVCKIELTENQTDYQFHKSILDIKSIRLNDSDIDLLPVGYDDNRIRPSAFAYDPDFWDVNSPQTETAGRPSRWSADLGTRILRIRQKPDTTAAALFLKLAVVRMPIQLLKVSDLEAEPEVPEEYHMMLAHAAAGRLLRHPTIDSDLRSLGRELLSEFDEFCKKAKKDRQRRQSATPQFRFGGWANDSYRNNWGT